LFLAAPWSSVAGSADVEPFRTSGGRLGFLIPGAVDPNGIRVMVDLDGPATGLSPWGIDRMSEGLSVYQHPPSETGWKWNNEGSVLYAVMSNTLAMVMPNTEATGTFRWFTEWYDDQWQVVRRFPREGAITNRAEELSSAPAWLDPPLPNVDELLRYAPTSLSRRAQRDFLDGKWTPLQASMPLPGVTVAGHEAPARITLNWTDPRTGQSINLLPESVEQDHSRTRWRGRVDIATEWLLVAETSAVDEVDVFVIVLSKEERCFRLSVGVQYPSDEWTWHDDMAFASAMHDKRNYAHDYASPYGLKQRRSYYPFAVISSEKAILVAETDGREPRQFQIEAETSERRLSVHYDMAVSPLTGHFPGMATAHARFRTEPRTSVDPFRSALQTWYQRDPAWYTARSPKHGLWLPFTDINTIAGAEDFHFAFFEKVGPLGNDVETAHASGVLNFPYTEPWLYWLPMNDPAKWNRTAAVERMQELAQIGLGKEREFASSGFLGASHDSSLNRRITFLNTPWSNGGRMEVNTDPELPITRDYPVNRAMAEWRYIQEVLEDPRVDGIYLDSMSAMETIDYNPQALKVADYPATFVMADLKPGLAMPVQAVEFTAALGNYLKANNKHLMGNFPCWKFPFFMPYIDVPGEETTWYSGNQFTPLSGRELNYRRAISGAKPFGFLQATHFEQLTRSDIEKYFRECLFYAFMPSFFSHDGANDPYWVDAAMYERDRPLFRKYLPMTIRLSEAGWIPVPAAQTDGSAIRIEQFGRAADDVFFLTVRNTMNADATESLTLSGETGPRLVYDMFSGKTHHVNEQNPSFALHASPSEITCLVLIRPEALSAEVPVQKAWTSNNVIYAAAARNLGSLDREMNSRVACEVRQESAVVGDEPVRLQLAIENNGPEPVTILDITGSKARLEIDPGSSRVIDLPEGIQRRSDGWIHVRWKLNANGRVQAMERILYPKSIEPFTVTAPGARIQSDKDAALLEYIVTGRRVGVTPVTLKWKNEQEEGTQSQDVAFDQPGFFRLDIPKDGRELRQVSVSLIADQQVIHESSTYVVFAPVLDHLAMKSDVRITADSAYSGYTTEVLNDGVVETAGLNWNEGAFATTESTEPHWIRCEFRNPETLSSVTVHWNREGGVTYASRCGEIWVTLRDGEQRKVGEFANEIAPAKTTVAFSSVEAISIELRQPPSCGSAERPGLLWLSELEIR